MPHSKPDGDLARVVLEAPQRRDRALPDDRALAKEADLGAARDDALAHEAPGDRADARDAEDLADLGLAGDDLLEDRREQAEHRGLDLLDQLVDDLVGADLHALGLGELAAAPVRAHVEPDDRRVGGLGELDVVLGDPADAAMTSTSFTSSRSSLRSDSVHASSEPCTSAFKHDVERRGLAALDLLEEVLQARAAGRGHGLVADEPRALGAGLGEGARVGQVVGDAHLVAGEGRLGEAEDAHGRRRPGGLDRLALVVDERLDLAAGGAGDDRVADLEQAALDHDRGDGAATDLEVGLEHRAHGAPGRPRGELGDVGDQQDLLEQLVDARCPAGRRSRRRSCRRPTSRAPGRAR